MANSLDHIAQDNHPRVFDELEKPWVMGAIWHGAFSRGSLDYAEELAARPHLNIPGKEFVPLKNILAGEAKTPGARALVKDLTVAERLFCALGWHLIHKGYVHDLSRVEPALATPYITAAGRWHADGEGALIGLSVLAGNTVELLHRPIDGTYSQKGYFEPSDPEAAEQLAQPVDPSDFVIMKAATFPHRNGISEKGAVHRRPNSKLEREPRQARPVVHYKIG